MRVVIAYDGGDAGDRALTAISNWARTTSADVHLITVLHPNEVKDTTMGHMVHTGLTPAGTQTGQLLRIKEPMPVMAESRSQAVEGVHAEAEERLRDIASRYLGGLDVEVHSDIAENTADGIIAYAQHVGAELIAIGTHGRTGLTHLLMGSVAERVVRQSTIPVLVVGPKVGGNPV